MTENELREIINNIVILLKNNEAIIMCTFERDDMLLFLRTMDNYPLLNWKIIHNDWKIMRVRFSN